MTTSAYDSLSATHARTTMVIGAPGGGVRSRRRRTRGDAQLAFLPDREKPAKRRLSAIQRGYGQHHRRLRKLWSARVAAGGVACARCGRAIDPSEPWDLGHDDHDRSAYQGPEHRKCNRSTAGRIDHRISSRKW